MSKSVPAAPSAAIVFTKRNEIREAIRKAFKDQGMKAEDIVNATDERECRDLITEREFSILVLDWEFGPDVVQKLLTANRKESRLESHPVFLVAAKDEAAIIAVAKEFFISHISIGEINTDTIRDQVKAISKEFVNVNPVRKVLLAIDACKKNGDWLNAIEMMEKILETHADNERVIIELAESYIHIENWEKAEAVLRGAMHTEDCGPRVKQLFARCKLKTGDYNAAIASLKGAQLLSPYNCERLLELGQLFLKMDRLDEAQDAFDDILEFAPDSKDATFGKSTTKLLMGDINEGLQLLNGMANARELSAVFNTAAILAIRQKRHDAGLALYQKALQLLAKKPKLVARVLYNMGIAYTKAGQAPKARRCFEKAVESDPDFTDAAHNLKVLKNPASAAAIASHAPNPATDGPRVGKDDFLEVDDQGLPPGMVELGLEHGEEEVELEDVLNDVS